jgi:hypothetical protein
MATTARQFAADLEQAGCRITWDDSIGWPGANFYAETCRGKQRKRVLVTFWGEAGGGFWYAQDQFAHTDRRLRSMKAVREHLGVAK